MKKSPNTTTAPTGNVAPFGLRMLPDLREKIESAAKASGRSMNAEIVARLTESFEEKFPGATGFPVVTVTIDSKNEAFGWDGILEVLAALREKGLNFADLSVRVITPEFLAGTPREEDKDCPY